MHANHNGSNPESDLECAKRALTNRLAGLYRLLSFQPTRPGVIEAVKETELMLWVLLDGEIGSKEDQDDQV